MSTKEKEVAVKGPMASPRVTIDWDVYQKIMYWVNKAPGEISGLGKVVPKEDGTFRVTSAVLIKQENGAASTEMDGAAISKCMFELKDDPGHLNFWWHSHVNMEVFWSGTDIDTIREIGQNGFVVATVFNKKREMKSAVYVKPTDILPEVFIDDLPTKPLHYLKPEQVTAWDAEYDLKTVVKTYNYTGYNRDDWGHWDRENGVWVPPPAKMTKAEKKALKKSQAESTTSSTDTNDAVIKENLMVQFDTLSECFYGSGSYKIARVALNKICGIIATTKFGSEETAEELRANYIGEFNMCFKEGFQLESHMEAMQ